MRMAKVTVHSICHVPESRHRHRHRHHPSVRLARYQWKYREQTHCGVGTVAVQTANDDLLAVVFSFSSLINYKENCRPD